MINDFNIATDLQVELFIPNVDENLFIIGVSLVGGSDVLGSSGAFIIGTSLIGGDDVLSDNDQPGFDWNPVQAVTASAEIGIGGTVQDSLYFQPDAGNCRLVLQSYTFDPTNNSSIRPGTPVRVRLVRDDINLTLFNGFIDSLTVDYYVDGPNLINLNAFDPWKRLVNTRIPTLDTTGYGAAINPTDLIQEVADAVGIGYITGTTEGAIPTGEFTETIASKFIYDALEVGLGLSWIDPTTGALVFIPRPEIETVAPEGTYTIGNNHGEAYHLCMSDITVENNQDQVFNSLKVELTSDDTTFVVVKNQDSIDLYGEISTDVAINTTTETELTRWANEVFFQSPTRLVTSVETPAIDRTGTLTEAAAFLPGELIGVKYETNDLNINDYYTITKVSHSIDVNNWYTTLELWKEF
jgi:hypothetical protein